MNNVTFNRSNRNRGGAILPGGGQFTILPPDARKYVNSMAYGAFGTVGGMPTFSDYGPRPKSVNPNVSTRPGGLASRAASQSDIPYYLQRPEEPSQAAAAMEALSAFADGAVPQARRGGRFRGPTQVHEGETVVPADDGSMTVIPREQSEELKQQAMSNPQEQGRGSGSPSAALPPRPGQQPPNPQEQGRGGEIRVPHPLISQGKAKGGELGQLLQSNAPQEQGQDDELGLQSPVTTREERNERKRQALMARSQQRLDAEEAALNLLPNRAMAAAALQQGVAAGTINPNEGRGRELSDIAIGMRADQVAIDQIRRERFNERRNNQLSADARTHTPNDEFGGMTPDEFIRSRAGTGKPRSAEDIARIREQMAERRTRIGLRRGEIIGKPGEQATIDDVLFHRSMQRREATQQSIAGKQQRNEERAEAKRLGMSYRDYLDSKRRDGVIEREFSMREQELATKLEAAKTSAQRQAAQDEFNQWATRERIRNDQERTNQAGRRIDAEIGGVEQEQESSFGYETNEDGSLVRAPAEQNIGDAFGGNNRQGETPEAVSNKYQRDIVKIAASIGSLKQPQEVYRGGFDLINDIMQAPVESRPGLATRALDELGATLSSIGAIRGKGQSKATSEILNVLDAISRGEPISEAMTRKLFEGANPESNVVRGRIQDRRDMAARIQQENIDAMHRFPRGAMR